MMRHLFATSALLLLAATGLAADDKKAIKVLIITGDHGHNWKATTPFLKDFLGKAGMKVDVTETPSKDLTSDNLAKYDVLLLNYKDTKKGAEDTRWSEANKQAFADAVKGGKGLLVYHHASSAFVGGSDFAREFERIIAGGWRKQGNHGKRHVFTVTIRNQDHPITKGMPAEYKHSNDELYQNSVMLPDSVVLATAYSDKSLDAKNSGKHEPVVWVSHYGKGRVCENVLGHDVEAMKSPGFQALMIRGIEWCATGKVQSPVPKEGKSASSSAGAGNPWVVYEGGGGPGKGKHIVLVSGDEEYRSEEALPQLGKILATHHGFQCTVLFAIDPSDGTINPNKTDNIPGLEALKNADLMILFTRFRNLPDEQMKHIVEYVEAGKPIIGMRTATHAFSLKSSKTYGKYSSGGNKEWPGGFGRQILGETWVNHWGHHGSQSTRGILVEQQKDNPILRGIKDGDIWGPTDVYEAHPTSGDCTPLVLGQVLKGMKPDDPPAEGKDAKKNDPMMPIAWTKTYKTAGDKIGRVFTTTMGASQDLQSEGLRRLLVNAAYWAVGMEDKIAAQSNVAIVGEYKPLPFGFGKFKKGVKPADVMMK